MSNPDDTLRSPPSAQEEAAKMDARPAQHAPSSPRARQATVLGTTILDGREWEKAPFNTAPWGYCPHCGAKTSLREIAPAAKARCLGGQHEYWAAEAKPAPPPQSLSRSDEEAL